MRLPATVVAALSPFVSPAISASTELTVVRLGQDDTHTVARLRPVGLAPGPGVVLIDESVAGGLFTTARGLGLLVHELTHQGQWSTIPDFQDLYESAERERLRLGLQPWENPYEAVAYQTERRAAQHFMALGYA